MIGRIKLRIRRLLQSRKEKRHALVGPAHFWKIKRDFQFELMCSLGLQPNQKLLDLGCGTLRGGIPLIDYLDVGNYTGIDVRPMVINEALKELKEEGLESKRPSLIAFSKFGELNFNTSFDFMLAFSVLFHLEDPILEDAFRFVANYLSPNGKFIANVHSTTNINGEWQEFPVKGRSIHSYQLLAAKFGMKTIVLGPLNKFGHQTNYSPHDSQLLLSFELGSKE